MLWKFYPPQHIHTLKVYHFDMFWFGDRTMQRQMDWSTFARTVA